MVKLDSNWAKVQKILNKSGKCKKSASVSSSTITQVTTARSQLPCNSHDVICDLIRKEKGLETEQSNLEP